MIYFKNEKGDIFAFNEDDVSHDELVKQSIAEIEQEIVELQSSNEEDATQKLSSLQKNVDTLKASIRISDDLVKITESEKDELLKPSDEQLAIQHAKSEHSWVKSELERVDEQLKYHWTDDRDRKDHTEQAWIDYAIALRDYTSTDADGNPVIVGESRPSINDYV